MDARGHAKTRPARVLGAFANWVTVQNQKNVVQRLLIQAASDRNISTTPQPRKPSQTIIAETINVASEPITSFLLIGVDKDRALILAPCRSTG